MRQALLDLGYADVYHMASILGGNGNPRDCEMWVRAFDAIYGGKGKFGKEQWDQLLGHCMAVSDEPCISFTYELIETYPEAKVILLTRDVDKWYESYMDTVGGYFQIWYKRYHNPWSIYYYLLPSYHAGNLFGMFFKYRQEQWAPARAKRWYSDQQARVRHLVPKDQLLEFDVRQGWKPLCEFLDKSVPEDRPFPKLMERDEFRQMNRSVRNYELLLMAVNAAKALGVLALAVLATWYGSQKWRKGVIV